MNTGIVPYREGAGAFSYPIESVDDHSSTLNHVELNPVSIEKEATRQKPIAADSRAQGAVRNYFLESSSHPAYPLLFLHEMAICQDWTHVEETPNWKIRSKIEKARCEAILRQVENEEINKRLRVYWRHLKMEFQELIVKLKEHSSFIQQ